MAQWWAKRNAAIDDAWCTMLFVLLQLDHRRRSMEELVQEITSAICIEYKLSRTGDPKAGRANSFCSFKVSIGKIDQIKKERDELKSTFQMKKRRES